MKGTTTMLRYAFALTLALGSIAGIAAAVEASAAKTQQAQHRQHGTGQHRGQDQAVDADRRDAARDQHDERARRAADLVA